ncbi:MAG: hypothetical protein JWQ19_1662 [Subtercola sp.]|nr:hypothetical protein [Subtercola sp.]
MKEIHYAGGVLNTGDDIADAVVHFAESLARRVTSAAVDIPARLADGSVAKASLLLGPASQLVCIPQLGDADEVVDAELVAHLYAEAARLADPKPLTTAEESTYDDPGL